MTWRPGLIVLTDSDRAAWLQWRAERKRQQQRERRARYPRIDYYPDPLAADAIGRYCGPFPGGDLSSVINRIVGKWLAQQAGRPLTPE